MNNSIIKNGIVKNNNGIKTNFISYFYIINIVNYIIKRKISMIEPLYVNNCIGINTSISIIEPSQTPIVIPEQSLQPPQLSDKQPQQNRTLITSFNVFKIYILSSIMSRVNNQDFIQKSQIIINIFIELYRATTSSLLIIFVPQKCDYNICSKTEILQFTGILYNFALIFNFVTLLLFMFVYILEIIREVKLIDYLDVNNNMPNDNEYIKNVITILPIDKINEIFKIVKYYKLIAYISIFAYIINTILSGIIIYYNNIANLSLTTFITYILFMYGKIKNIIIIINTEEHVFYSAYLRTNIQFNDVDPTFKPMVEISNEPNIDLSNEQCVDISVEPIVDPVLEFSSYKVAIAVLNQIPI
jgi:hypothetical protein